MKNKILLSVATLAAFAVVPLASTGVASAMTGGGGGEICAGHGGGNGNPYTKEVTRGGNVYITNGVTCPDGTDIEFEAVLIGPVSEFCF